MEKTGSDATADMRKTVDDTASDLQRATEQCATRWDGELNGARAEMHSRVDAGLDRIDKMVNDLGPKIDKEAAAAPSVWSMSVQAAGVTKQGFWSQVGSFVKGVIAGLAEAVDEMIVGLVKLLDAYVMALVHGDFLVGSSRSS